jgi:hypothetical protein
VLYFSNFFNCLPHFLYLFLLISSAIHIIGLLQPPNSPYNASFNAHENELEQKKKIETLKRQQEDAEDLQKKEPVQKSKNVSGPPVYYPPGHEMFAKKEEGGAWRAEV